MKISYILKRFCIAIVCMSISYFLFAQEEATKPVRYLKEYTITGQPTSIISGGFRVDFEKRMEGRHWLRVAPTIYFFPSPYDNNYWYDTEGALREPKEYQSTMLLGLGIDLGYKYFIERLEICYVLGGVHYSFLNLHYDYNSFIPYYEEDGITYYRNGVMEERQTFNRMGAIACIGIQTPQKKGFFIDTYIGIGYRYAFYDEHKAHFDYNPWGYGYRGFHLAGGFRIGVAFGSYAMPQKK